GTNEAMRLQREADLLYLPLAFETPWEDEIRTVYPTKAVEYLLSGTPILLHAPPGCYTVEDARRYGWAYVVDTQNPAALGEAVRILLEDTNLRRRLTQSARAAALARDARAIAGGLQADMGLSRT
ncbi:MAG: glycosyltransferase, partial [Myxococcota bacterium]